MRYLAVIFGLCASGGMADVPSVAVDIAPVHSIVSAVMGDLGQPDLIVAPGASPHGYNLRPSEARSLDQADLVVWIGEALVPWMADPVDSLASGASALTLMEVPGTTLLEIRKGATFSVGHDGHDHKAHDHDGAGEQDQDVAADAAHAHQDEAHDAAHNDAHHGGRDPHVWLDPRNAAIWADAIAVSLAELDPQNASIYSANTRKFRNEMAMLEDEIAAVLEAVKGRPFVVFHDAYHYFEHRFDIEAIGAISAVDASLASAGRVAQVRERMAELGAVCALSEPQFNPGIIAALGDVRLGQLDPMGAHQNVGAELYAHTLRAISTSLLNCLK